ncbi:MAG: CBS domain-containing protein [Betaproteobacteria bacterium]|nr:CBS domain-containing protein [Betaproteobacteria bacterium]
MPVPHYSALPARPLERDVRVQHPDHAFRDLVTLNDPALVVMTDLRRMMPVTIEPDSSLEGAARRMKQRGVRLLLVLDEQERVIGLITSTDLEGEKPMRHIHQHGGTRQDILVRDIMTPQQMLDTLCMDDVVNAKVGQVVATLQRVRRQHALVVERNGEGEQVVRGIFSASQIARQLAAEIQTADVIKTFSEIKELLGDRVAAKR